MPNPLLKAPGGTLGLHTLFKATRGPCALSKLRENRLAVSHGFCMKCFRSAMRPRIAFRCSRLRRRELLLGAQTQWRAGLRDAQQETSLLLLRGLSRDQPTPATKARNSRVASRVPDSF